MTKADLLTQLQTLRGYDVLAHRAVQKNELVLNDWEPDIPRYMLCNYGKYPNYIKPPFAHWAVYERNPEYSEMPDQSGHESAYYLLHDAN